MTVASCISTGYRQNPPTTKPPRDKIPFKVNDLRFTVNVVNEEKNGSTVYGVFYLHYAAQNVIHQYSNLMNNVH